MDESCNSPPKLGGSFAHESPFCLFLPCRFRGFLLFESRSNKRVIQPVIPFMASVLEQWTDGFLQGKLSCPWPGPRGLILDGEFVLNGVGFHAGEPLHDTQVLA